MTTAVSITQVQWYSLAKLLIQFSYSQALYISSLFLYPIHKIKCLIPLVILHTARGVHWRSHVYLQLIAFWREERRDYFYPKKDQIQRSGCAFEHHEHQRCSSETQSGWLQQIFRPIHGLSDKLPHIELSMHHTVSANWQTSCNRSLNVLWASDKNQSRVHQFIAQFRPHIKGCQNMCKTVVEQVNSQTDLTSLRLLNALRLATILRRSLFSLRKYRFTHSSRDALPSGKEEPWQR